MGVKERRQREKKFLREEILDAARELFIKHGYDNVTMRKIGAKIEYSPTTIYLYFQDKCEILHTLCEETFGKLLKVFNGIERSPLTPVEKLTEMGKAYIRFGLQHPNEYRMTFMTQGVIKAPEHFEETAGMKTFQCLLKCVQDCIDSGEFRPINVPAAGQALWSAVHGVTSLLINSCGFPFVETEVLIDTVLDATINGLRPK